MADFSASALIQQVVNSVNQSSRVLTQGAGELAATGAQQEQLLQRGQQEMAGAIADASAAAAGKAAIDYTRNKAMEDIQRLYRLDPSQNNFVIAQRMNEVEQAQQARIPVKAEYDQLASKDFLTDPIGWIFAQTKIPQVAAQNNALADIEDNAFLDMQRRQAAMAASRTTIVANTADAIQANQLDTAAAVAREAGAKLDMETAKNLSLISANKLQQIQLADKINDNQRSAIGVIASIQNAEETRAMRKEAKDANLEYKLLQKLMLGEKLDELKGKKEEKDLLNVRLAEVSTSMGHTVPMTIDRLKALGDTKDQQAWLSAARAAGYGATVEDATNFFLRKQSLPSGQNASLIATARKLEATGAGYVPVVSKAMQLANPTGKLPPPADIRNSAYNQYTLDMINSTATPGVRDDLSSNKWDRTFNAYVAPFISFSKAIDTQPELAGLKNNIVKKHLDTLIASGSIRGENLSSDQQQQLVLAVQQQLASRKLTSGQAAAQLTDFMKAASAYNLGMNKYNLFALPEQTSYLFSVPDAGQANLFDQASTENMLVRGVKAAQQPWGYTPFGFR